MTAQTTRAILFAAGFPPLVDLAGALGLSGAAMAAGVYALTVEANRRADTFTGMRPRRRLTVEIGRFIPCAAQLALVLALVGCGASATNPGRTGTAGTMSVGTI